MLWWGLVLLWAQRNQCAEGDRAQQKAHLILSSYSPSSPVSPPPPPPHPPPPPLSGCQPAHFTLFDLNVGLNLSDLAEEQKSYFWVWSRLSVEETKRNRWNKNKDVESVSLKTSLISSLWHSRANHREARRQQLNRRTLTLTHVQFGG